MRFIPSAAYHKKECPG